MKKVISIKQLNRRGKFYMDSYNEWLKRANSSFELAKYSDNELIYYEDLCFQLQQAVEKGLKGLLIFYGAVPEKTHHLYGGVALI